MNRDHALKGDARYAAIPVIAHSAQPDLDRLGLFQSVCPKPCPPDELLRLVAAASEAAPGACLRAKDVRARAIALRQRALTLCRAFTRPSMRARLAGVLTALGEPIERLDRVSDDELCADPAERLSESTNRIAECETLLRIGGPDVEGTR